MAVRHSHRVGYDVNGVELVRTEKTTTGAATALRLTSATPGSVFTSFVDTGAGVNRVFVRARFTLRATASGLTAATASVTSIAFTTNGGLA